MYVVCAEHLNQALDEFLERYEMAPDLYELAQVKFTDWQVPDSCTYCGRAPKYLLI